MTVDGIIAPEELGRTMTHEHVFIDLSNWYTDPGSAYRRAQAENPVTMENLSELRRNPMASKDNLLLGSMEEAVDEVGMFRDVGGDTIVEVTPKGPPGQDPEQLRLVSRRTGVQLIQGTAYYVRTAHPDGLDERSEQSIEDEFVSDVRDGIDETDVQAGIIGEIGLSTDADSEIYDTELTVLKAAARAAVRTGASLSIHPPGRKKVAQRGRTYPTSRWSLEVLDIVEEQGLPADRVVMGHMDRTLYEDIDYLKQLAERGPYLEFDLFGSEFYYDHWDDGYPADEWRIETIAELVDEGHLSQILLSHDVCQKIQRVNYGGFGYAHVIDNVVPMFEQLGGLDGDQIQTMLVDNPREMLTFAEPEEAV